MGVVATVFVDVWALFCQREAVESSNISNDYLHFDSFLSKVGGSPLEMLIESRNLFGMNLN